MAFEAFLTQDRENSRPRKWRRFTYALSLSLHGAALLGAAAYSFWRVDELQPPSVAVRFLANYVPPPPPLPAPAPVAAAPKPAAPQPKTKPATLTQPTPTPATPAAPTEAEPVAQAAAEAPSNAGDGDPNATGPGDPAGVAGGESMAVAPAPAPPAPQPPEINLAPSTGTQLRTTDINDPRFRPTLPPALNRGGMVIAGLFKICVSPQGHVKGVSIMKSADPLVDELWSALIRTWEYRPYSVGGQAVAFCHAARIEVRAQS